MQGWHADPFRLHGERYFSAGTPTKLVRDGSVESYDDPPSGPWEPPAVATAVLPGDGPAQAGQHAAGEAACAPHAAPARYSAADAPEPRRRTLAGVFMGTVFTALAAGMVILVIATMARSQPSAGTTRLTPVVPGAGIAPAAFVTQAARQTLAQRTAHLTMSGTLQPFGQAMAIRATGAADFTADSLTLDIRYTYTRTSATVDFKEILAGGSTYLTLNAAGVPARPGGPRWFKEKPASGGQAGPFDGAPGDALTALTDRGNTVRALGTRIIGGVTCSGYSVTPKSSAESLMVCIDAQRLVREISTGMPGSGGGAPGGTLAVDFSDFGAPVRITAPAPSDIAP
jgi:hypothetical protein